MSNTNLGKAKAAKNDEFYTQYADIQNEINAYIDYKPDVFRDKTILLPCDDPEWSNFTKFFINNFERYGIKKLISTSYAYNSKKVDFDYQPTLFETIDPRFKIETSMAKGKIFTLTKDENKDGKIDEKDLKWDYLEGDGDFRSDEIKKLRDEADIIITNPPFSLFREFVAWIFEGKKSFAIIGNMNAVSYKEIFTFIKANKMWMGNGFNQGNAYFGLPESSKKNYSSGVLLENGLVKFRNCSWYTNIEHGKRHQKLKLMSEIDNIKFSKHQEIKNKGYLHYCNYDAIDVPYIDAIPSDYKGVMGVPRSFFEKYNPEQFEIIGTDTKEQSEELGIKPIGDVWIEKYKNSGGTGHITSNMRNLALYDFDGTPKTPYARILIKHK